MNFRLVGVLLAVVLMAPWLAAQQFHGIGASLTTSSGVGITRGFGGGFTTHGIPPSLTSITPSPRSGFFTVSPGGGHGNFGRGNFGHGNFGNGNFGNGNFGHGHFGRGNNFIPIYVPIYYPSYPYYPYADSGYYMNGNGFDQSNNNQPEDPQPPALTIFENRPGYQPPPVDRSYSRDYDRSQQPSATEESSQKKDQAAPVEEPKVADQAPTVLIFRDGHELEVSNYAIQGETLFNLGSNGPRKIKLADLDLAKTIQANDERGNEFRLPKALRG